MVVFRAVEAFQRRDLGDDGLGENLGGIELLNVGGGDALLLVVGVEDGRAIRGAYDRVPGG